MEINDNQMIIFDEQGNEHVVEIVLEYENEERQTKYVIFYEAKDPDNVMAMKYNDEGELFDIEDEEEFNEVAEVFNAFQDEEGLEEE